MRVLVVGAGPTGAALSLLLARSGVEVLLLEREEDFGRVFRGEALMPNGVDAIAQMGLAEEFAQLPQRRVECMEFYVDDTLIIRADWPEMAGENAACLVSQPGLLQLLTATAAGHATFELQMGTTVRNMQVTTNGVEVSTRHGTTDETLFVDFVIGADGRGSLVRARNELKVEQLPFPFDVAWFSLPIPPSQLEDPRFQAFSRGGRSVALYPSWDGKLRLGLNLPSRAKAASKDSLLEEVLQVVDKPYGPFIRDHMHEVSEPVTLKILFGRCERWSTPRVLLLGDAAHPMSPVRAQGINLALRDAIVAANHLIPALTSGDADTFQHAAETIQKEREPEVIESQRLQVSMTQPPPPARSAFLRATLLPVLRKAGLLKRVFLKAEIPLRHGVVPVELAV